MKNGIKRFKYLQNLVDHDKILSVKSQTQMSERINSLSNNKISLFLPLRAINF